MGIDVGCGNVELVQNPPLDQGFVACELYRDRERISLLAIWGNIQLKLTLERILPQT